MSIPLSGRTVKAWITQVLPDSSEVHYELRDVKRIVGRGPDADTVDLARWAAWRWAGSPVRFLRAASPSRHVEVAVGAHRRASGPDIAAAKSTLPRPEDHRGEFAGMVDRCLGRGESRPVILRIPPAAGRFDLVARVATPVLAEGRTVLLLTPTTSSLEVVAESLEQSGFPVARMPEHWDRAAAGSCVVVGMRAAAWAPTPELAAVIVLDAHDTSYVEERAPTWSAVDVVAERARRAGAHCLLVSPCPTPEMLAVGDVVSPPRALERRYWPPVVVIDRREDDPRTGLLSPALFDLVSTARPDAGCQVVCVLNRKGRARMLQCTRCNEVARCELCGAAVAETRTTEVDSALQQRKIHPLGELQCPSCGATRPPVCAMCGSTRLRMLRVGVQRIGEELSAATGLETAELSADVRWTDARGVEKTKVAVIVGTEAALNRLGPVGAVAFLDFDQELLAPRFRAGGEALALLARAARLTAASRIRGNVLVQTRVPHHPIIRAAVDGDPEGYIDEELRIRSELGLPPFRALALLSGDGVAEVVDALDSRHGIEPHVQHPPRTENREGCLAVHPVGLDRWLVRARDHEVLCNALDAALKSGLHCRVEVDPLRI